MSYFDAEFSTNQISNQSPFNTMVKVDGFIIPLDSLPEEYQEMVHQARARGEDIEFHTE